MERLKNESKPQPRRFFIINTLFLSPEKLLSFFYGIMLNRCKSVSLNAPHWLLYYYNSLGCKSVSLNAPHWLLYYYNSLGCKSVSLNAPHRLLLYSGFISILRISSACSTSSLTSALAISSKAISLYRSASTVNCLYNSIASSSKCRLSSNNCLIL